MGRGESIHLALHLLAPIVLLVAGVNLVSAMLEPIAPECGYARDLLPSRSIVIAGIAGLFLGRYLSKWGQPREYATHEAWTPAIFYGAWFGGFLLFAGLWFYEAMGTAHVLADRAARVDFEPITYYVRCAAYQDLASESGGLWITLGVVLISGIVGHWLWSSHPSDGPRSIQREAGK